MRRDGGYVVMSGGCLMLLILATAGLAVLGAMLWSQAREAAPEEPPKQDQETVSPWAETDAVLKDQGPQRRVDPRPEAARRGVADAKAERNRLEAEERAARAEVEKRKQDISRLRAEIASAERRLERLRAEALEDPDDEEAKERLYETWVQLNGGEGREGLKARSVRAAANLSEATARADGISRKLRELNSGIAGAESEARRVEGAAGYESATEASRRGMGAVRSVEGLAESTENESTDAAAEAAGARERRDAVLHGILEK